MTDQPQQPVIDAAVDHWLTLINRAYHDLHAEITALKAENNYLRGLLHQSQMDSSPTRKVKG